MKKVELADMTARELRELCGRSKVTLTKDMKKAEMIAALGRVSDTAIKHQPGPACDCPAPPETHACNMEQAVEDSKYYTGPAPQAALFGLPTELPSNYNDDKIALMVRDPYWAYTYWEVTQRKLDSARTELGDGGGSASLIIRIYDITDVDFNGTNANFHHDLGVYGHVGDWYIDMVRPGRSFVADLGLKTADGRFVTLARSNFVTTPRDGVSDVLDEEWVMAERDFERIFALSGGYGVGMSSADIRLAAGGRLPFGMSSPGMGSLALMSPSMKRQRGFWYMLNTELIVYGATEPDARVTVQGRQVNVRPDGTFTLRFALPDGDQNIPVSFTSADEVDTGWITPKVGRRTKYN